MRRVRQERGSILVISILLMTLMMSVAMAGVTLVDQVQRESGRERQSETAFNLTEALLSSQVFILSRGWPGTSGNPYPSSCTAGVTDSHCPDASSLLTRFGGPDLAAGITWSTMVRDNQSPNPNYYDATLTATGPSYDANHDGELWVRAQAVLRGRRRTLVGLVRVERVTEQLPYSVVVAGHFGTTNSGRKVIVDTQGSAAAPAPLQVRCVGLIGCLDYPANKGQVKPDTSQTGYTGANGLSDDALARLRERAIADGTYTASGCPANPSGAVVFVENGDCTYNNSTPGPFGNSTASPGVLIFARGTLSMSGNIVYHGLVYMANQQNSSGWVVSLTGTAAIQGSVQIDGAGGLMAGSSAVNVVFDPNVFAGVVSYGNAGIIQNTWREIPG